MEPGTVNPDTFDFWKWIAGAVIGAISGAITAAMTISRVIFKLNNACMDVDIIKQILFKKTGGLNLLSEDRHREICVPNMTMVEQDFDHFREQLQALKEQFSKMDEKMDIILNSSHAAGQHAEELRKMNALMAEISHKLGRAWKMDQDNQVGHG